MLLADINWRDIYKKIFLLTRQQGTWLAACEISYERGLVLLPLAEAKEAGAAMSFVPLPAAGELYPGEDPSAAAAEITLLPGPMEQALGQQFAAPLASFAAAHAVAAAVEETRSIELLDAHRQPWQPDVVTVYIGRAAQETEPLAYPVRVSALQAPRLSGRLCVAAPQLGLSAGATVDFVIVRQAERNRIICLSVLA